MSTRETVSQSGSAAREEPVGHSKARPGGPDAHLVALQQGAGNQFVQRMLRASPPPFSRGRRASPIRRGRALPTIQRYRVRVPRNADCETVADWLDSSGPHSPDWALTTVDFSLRPAPHVEAGEGDGEYVVTFPTATVGISKTVDMPNWRPPAGPMREAWSAAYAELRTHEAEHEAIGDRWKTTLEGRLHEFSTTVTAESERAAGRQGVAALSVDWEIWGDEHQADQDLIDPFNVTLICPVDEEDEEAGTAIGIEAHGEPS